MTNSSSSIMNTFRLLAGQAFEGAGSPRDSGSGTAPSSTPVLRGQRMPGDGSISCITKRTAVKARTSGRARPREHPPELKRRTTG